MVPSDDHVPPAPPIHSHVVDQDRTGPPAADTRFNDTPLKNPRSLESGDQKGRRGILGAGQRLRLAAGQIPHPEQRHAVASSCPVGHTPAVGRNRRGTDFAAFRVDDGHAQRARLRCARARPHAGDCQADDSDAASCEPCRCPDERPDARRAATGAAPVDSPARPLPEPRAIVSSISSRASPMSRSRRFGSFSRHRASRRLIDAGVVAGSAVQSGSRVRTAARTSLIGVAGKSGPAREHLVEDEPERPDVRALVYRLAPRLLRRHVGGRAENHAAHRERSRTRERWRVQRVRTRPAGRSRSREAEIQHLHRAVGAQLDVRGLQIAMDDPLLVRRFESLGDLPGDRQGLIDRDRAPAAMRCERSSPSTSSITRAYAQPADFSNP